jgi:lipoyl(octanoyl) transferase
MSGTTTQAAAAPTPAGGPPRPALDVRRLGTVGYAEALALQSELVRARRAGSIPDTLLLLEHPHVITLGSGSDPAHVLADVSERATRGIELYQTGRGGDVTYHGPGQLVGYPILALEEPRRDVHRYLRDLEGALIDALAGLGVAAATRPGLTGVWTPLGKIAAIGVRVSSGWITSHGFALNVTTDLTFFDTIMPCGIAGCVVTSVERELGGHVTVAGVQDTVAGAMATRLGRVLV